MKYAERKQHSNKYLYVKLMRYQIIASRRRKWSTVKTATNRNGDSQNGDRAETATNHNGDFHFFSFFVRSGVLLN